MENTKNRARGPGQRPYPNKIRPEARSKAPYYEKSEECPVCFESLENQQESLRCGHWVHAECIIKQVKSECPLCRAKIPQEPLYIRRTFRPSGLWSDGVVFSPFVRNIFENPDRKYFDTLVTALSVLNNRELLENTTQNEYMALDFDFLKEMFQNDHLDESDVIAINKACLRCWGVDFEEPSQDEIIINNNNFYYY